MSVSYYSLKHESWYHFHTDSFHCRWSSISLWDSSVILYTHRRIRSWSVRGATLCREPFLTHACKLITTRESRWRWERSSYRPKQSNHAAARPSGSLDFVLIVQMWTWSLTAIVRLKHVTPTDWDPKQYLSLCSSADNKACLCRRALFLLLSELHHKPND